jgi:hypothetical protein
MGYYRGTTWGLGGTCVNVGCIPKKLMHHAALVGNAIRVDAPLCGWGETPKRDHDWAGMMQVVTDHVKGLNFMYKVRYGVYTAFLLLIGTGHAYEYKDPVYQCIRDVDRWINSGVF